MGSAVNTSGESDTELQNRLMGFIGRDDGPTSESFVDPTVVKRLVEALGDRNPVYSDPTLAEGTSHGAVVAPATSLMSWTVSAKPLGVHGVDDEGRRLFRLEPAPAGSASVKAVTAGAGSNGGEWGATIELRELLKSAGFLAPAVTNGWYEYMRYLKPGERITIGAPRIDEIVGPKRTSLGEGYFVTQSQRVFDAAGEVVAVMRRRDLRSRPDPSAKRDKAKESSAADSARAGSERPRPAAHMTADLPWEPSLASVAIGDTLPELVIELTPTQIIAGALASQDWAPIHHDRDFAQSMGHPDIFLNTQMSTGFVSRFITDWAGADAVIEALDFRLGIPSYTYDTMTIGGEVTALEQLGPRSRVTVAVVGRNSLGVHITSNVTFTIPSPSRATSDREQQGSVAS